MSSNLSHSSQGTIARLDGAWKRYEMRRDRHDTLRARLTNVFRRSRQAEYFWALRDVTLTVHAGETVGIIGANGSGKTTILKLLAGITTCTRGSTSASGRIGALIELGAGFHPELSGRDNVFLSGAILGLSRDELRRRYDSIVDFAELHHFIDTPVKYYSSGMAVRLGFAIAANIDADLLLVDEALAVGDRSFQDKSLQRILQMQRERRSFVVVSHSLNLISQVCHRAVWLDAGRVRADGDADTVVAEYLSATEPPSPQVGVQTL